MIHIPRGGVIFAPGFLSAYQVSEESQRTFVARDVRYFHVVVEKAKEPNLYFAHGEYRQA
jgi:hypothetical protein